MIVAKFVAPRACDLLLMEVLGAGEEQEGHIGRLLQATEWVVGSRSFLCTMSGSLKPVGISPRKISHPASEDSQS